jgi:uncharacterized protein
VHQRPLLPARSEQWRKDVEEGLPDAVLALCLEMAQAAVREHAAIGRNQPCPCGSGKKFKKCCGSTKAMRP